MKQKIAALFLFLVLCVGGWGLIERSRYNLVSSQELLKAREHLKVLSTEEQEDLATFFSYATIWSQYAYTLVESKPMSICNFFQPSEDLPSWCKEIYERPHRKIFFDSLERGYQVWEKYQTLAPPTKYQLVRYHHSASKGRIEIALIHTPLCQEILRAHLSDFQEVLGSSKTLPDLLSIFAHPEHVQFYTLVEHERLRGTLLGFGRNNAYLYEQNIRSKLFFFSSEYLWWPKKWRLPGFVADPTSLETKHLHRHYKRAQKHIYWTYFGRNDLEVTLALLSKS